MAKSPLDAGTYRFDEDAASGISQAGRLLLDKKLDQFVAALCKHYDVKTAKLPTHYKEALTLYIHRRSKPVIEYHDNVVDTDFQDYQQLEHKYANKQEMQNAIRDTYGNTYWYYFDYCSK